MEINGVKIEWLGHSGFIIQCRCGGEKKIAIDPYNISERAVENKADIILITHSHYDHCSIKDIERLVKQGTVIVCPADVESKITRIEGVQMEVIESGDEIVVGNVRIEAIPAYNVSKDFHTKKDFWIGYLIKACDAVVYHAGDTDKISEMEKLTGYGKKENNFVALLPVSGTFTMTAEEAAEAAALIKPDVAVPMHYGSGVAGTKQDADLFVKLCKEKGVNAEILEKI